MAKPEKGKPRSPDDVAKTPSAEARLIDLRRELKRQGVGGFIVPHADEHQNEFLPENAERLAWLTGFTGSAGLAIVLEDRAALFVDGRYTLQAKDEVDRGLYEIRHLTEEPPEDWIAGALSAGSRLGYDSWLHTPDQVARYRRACDKAAAELVALEPNPLDAVWADRPPPPAAPIVAYDEAYAGRPSADKLKEIAGALAKGGADAAVLSALDSIAWLFNIRGGDLPYTPLALAFAVVHADATADLFVDDGKVGEPVRRHLGGDVRLRPPEALGPALDRLGEEGKAVRLDGTRTPSWVHERLRDSGAKVLRGDDPCALPKAQKNAVELEGMRAAHKRDGAAMVRFLAWLSQALPKGRVTEISAAAKLEGFRRENDLFRGLSFPTISGAGPNGAVVHYRVSETTNRELAPGSLYLVDSGAQYLDGTTDVTRTVAIGAPSAEMRERFTRVLKGHIALATVTFPTGTTGSQLDAIARRALWQAGLDYDHGTGHGVGCYAMVHEGPQRISKIPNRVALKPGMVLSNEPGYYKAGSYGIRIENLEVVKPLGTPEGGEKELLGFEPLTLVPIDLGLVDTGLLTPEERAWLEAYHRRVRETIAPLVDAATRRWLARATGASDRA